MGQKNSNICAQVGEELKRKKPKLEVVPAEEEGVCI